MSAMYDLSAIKVHRQPCRNIGEVAIVDYGHGQELTIIGAIGEQLYEVMLAGARAWRAFELNDDNELHVHISGTRIQIDPFSSSARPVLGNLLALQDGWAVRCEIEHPYRGRQVADVVLERGENATSFRGGGFSTWQIVTERLCNLTTLFPCATGDL